jgi:integrase
MKSSLDWSKIEHTKHPETYRRYKTSSKALPAHAAFKQKALDQITASLIEDFKAHRARQKGKRTRRLTKPATINRELACLKAMYFHTLKNRHDFKNPVSEVQFLPENNEQDRVLTFEEQRRYLAAANDTLNDVAQLIVETGMRSEEVYRATVANAHPDEGYLWNPYGKTKAARRKVPLNSTALEIVKRRMKAAEGKYLFPHRYDNDRPVPKMNNAHDLALKKSNVARCRLYDLRHTWATRPKRVSMS